MNLRVENENFEKEGILSEFRKFWLHHDMFRQTLIYCVKKYLVEKTGLQCDYSDQGLVSKFFAN